MTSTAVVLPMRYSVVVLPMLPLGAPVGVVVFHDLAQASAMRDLRARLQRHLKRTAFRPATPVHVFLYRVDLPLTAFPGQTSWRFMSTMPLSWLLKRSKVNPMPFQEAWTTTVHDCMAGAPDVLMTTAHEPPRVVHWIAEILELAPSRRDSFGVGGVPITRCSPHRQLLCQADPDLLEQLLRFLSSPPEPIPRRRTQRGSTAATATQTAPYSYPRAPPFYLNHVPAIAQLILPEHKMLVRPVFEKLLGEMLRDLPHTTRCVYVAATAGAGKTAFLWCIVHALCRRGRTSCGKFLAPTMDIVLDVPGLFVLIDTAGQVFTGPRRECFRIELMKKETLYLVDLAHTDHQELTCFPTRTVVGNDTTRECKHLDSLTGHASRILVSLPSNRMLWRARHVRACAVTLLPPWRDCELELCRRACFPAVDSALLLARTKV